LGNGADTSTRAPARVSGGIRFASITVGGTHTCALTPQGRAYCWGWNAFGQLGTGSDANSAVPAPVAGSLSFTVLSAGDQHTCGITTGGVAYCWGDNEIGQLGDSASVGTSCPAPFPCSQIPVHVSSTLHFRSISAGGYHTCGVATDGKAYCWGWDWDGQAGIGYFTDAPISVPAAVSTTLRFDAITAGAHHTCAVTTQQLAYCWGGGLYGQLGNDSSGSYNYVATPVAVVGGVRFAALTAGDNHTCGLAVNGGGLCWGTGPLGTAVTQVSTTPVAVAGGLRFEALDAGGQHQCGVSVDGPGFCWGLNTIGQLGIASSEAWRDLASVVVLPPSEAVP
jgi:alpha-tubulin suppressor-like RCC1 family protein